MPTVPKQTKCAYLGCNNPRSLVNTYCEGHGGKGYNSTAERKKSNALYKTALWQKLRIQQLSRQPMCQACILDNKITQATEVDHLFPWSQIGRHAFTLNIFQSLCRSHHTDKTWLERQGIFRHYKEPAPNDFGLADYKRLLMPNT